jgi:hypothetical protein
MGGMGMDRLHEIEISAVLYQEGAHWIAQGLEFDITAQADSLPDLKERFATKVAIEVAISLDMDKMPLEGIGRAPAQFWSMFDEAAITDVPAKTPQLETNGVTSLPKLPKITHTMKVRWSLAA